MRTINAPGVQITEIDKSQYSPAMVGTAAYIMGYTNKGEPFMPMEFTSRTAWTSFYGEPDNEAERYAYAAACEVLNNNGRLYFARLPYDNNAYGKFASITYKYETKDISSVCMLSAEKDGDPKLELSTSWSYISGNWDAYKATSGMSAQISNDEILSAASVTDELAVTIQALVSSYTKITAWTENESFSGFMSQLLDLDSTIVKATVLSSVLPKYIDLSSVDNYRSGEASVDKDKILIIDKTCGTYAKITQDSRKGVDRELIGIMPVITTAANALYIQNFLTGNIDLITNVNTAISDDAEPSSYKTIDSGDFPEADYLHNIAKDASYNFPAIQMNSENTGLDREHLNKIGVVVYKMFLDPTVGNKISMTPVESFVGSLGKDDKDPNTGITTYIDNIVNTNSSYIYLFSHGSVTGQPDINIVNPCACGSLGFYSPMTKEVMRQDHFLTNIQTCFDKVSDINERDIDIVCDAGLANIYSYMVASTSTVSAEVSYDLTDTLTMSKWSKACQDKSEAIRQWKTIEQKFDNFCKKTRKDCMFIADAPRPMVLAGNKKIVRSTKPENTIDANILPNLKWITGLNTSYGAGYLDWFEQADDYTGELFWCPPSIKAMGCYINTDVNFNYWDAPAGLTRGLISATDVAFSPTIAQAGAIYEKNWNYAINYPADGIVLEGQKTFQTKPSALDRVNVRRLMLRLERQVAKIARYFVYEGNTAYTRQRLIDMIDYDFKQAKVGGGLYDYKLVADESNNSPESIDRNELHVACLIKPTKTIEFICVDFVVGSTGMSWEEML